MNKAALKTVGAVTVGVLLAGLIMYQFSGITLVADAKHGFGG